MAKDKKSGISESAIDAEAKPEKTAIAEYLEAAKALEDVVPVELVDDVVEPVAAEPPPVVDERKASKVLVSFDRWFADLGKPDHWKDGMRAYRATSGKKTISQWDEIFKNY